MEITELNLKITDKQKEVNVRLKVVEEARKVNLLEKDKNRKFQKANAALKAKLDFIE